MLYMCSAAVFSQTTHFFMRSSLYGFTKTSWKRSIWHAGIRVIKLECILTQFPVRCYSSRRKPASQLPKLDPGSSMAEEINAFYVVRKGDVIGIYKTLDDCQAQVGPSVCDPSMSVYKGYSLPKEAEEHLISHGLKNAAYAIGAAHVTEDLFGTLVPCPFQQPERLISKELKKTSKQKRSTEVLDMDSNAEAIGSTSYLNRSLPKQLKLGGSTDAHTVSSTCLSCVLEFDGAAKGNPGKAGAGAVLRTEDGSMVWRLREGLGEATNNVAEYRALILGMKSALKKGFKKIRIQGDSKLVCMQIMGSWKTKHENMIPLCKEAKELRNKFLSFQIDHVDRQYNSEADAQANLAIHLPNGEVSEECTDKK